MPGLCLPTKILDLCFSAIPEPPADTFMLITLLAWVTPDDAREYYSKLKQQQNATHDNDRKNADWNKVPLFKNNTKEQLLKLCRELKIPVKPTALKVKNLLVNRNSQVCGNHFIDSVGCRLRPDEVPTENLPTLPTKVSQSRVRRPLVKKPLRRDHIESEVPDVVYVGDITIDVGTNTEIDVPNDRRTLEIKLNTLTAEIAIYAQEYNH